MSVQERMHLRLELFEPRTGRDLAETASALLNSEWLSEGLHLPLFRMRLLVLKSIMQK